MTIIDEARYNQLVATEKQIYHGERPSASIASIFTYWASRYLMPRLRQLYGATNIEQFFVNEIVRTCRSKTDAKWRILSLGSGECSLEVDISKQLTEMGADFQICCTDIAPEMIRAGRAIAAKAGLSDRFTFVECDINKQFPPGQYDVVIANHCLHHFVGLEHIFSGVKTCIGTNGAFVVSDMIGRNGHMRWPETLRIVEGFWNMLPPSKRVDTIHKEQRTSYINFNCAEGTFEGIRAEDIMPLLLDTFSFERFLGFGGLPDIFIDRMYGPNFDPANPEDTGLIDNLEMLNDLMIRSGAIKPTMLIATLRGQPVDCVFDPIHPYGAVRLPSWGEGTPGTHGYNSHPPVKSGPAVRSATIVKAAAPLAHAHAPLNAMNGVDASPMAARSSMQGHPAKPVSGQPKLVFDIGMHTGVDTAYYLAEGYRVVAVEANPSLVAAGEKRFARDIADGRLILEGIGIHEHDGELPFTINDQVDEWSSFIPHLGQRANQHHTVNVRCRPLSYFLETHGMPHFMKIDVEGMDAAIVRQLRDTKTRPEFISSEDGGIDSLIALYEVGVRQFKFVNQIESQKTFGGSSSGTFGDALPGEWLPPTHAFAFYLTKVRPPDSPPLDGFWDIHGKF
jgi:FkbM family methyltransferase